MREEGKLIAWLEPTALSRLRDHIHPACACFEATEKDVERMKESLHRDGVMHLIVLLDGELLDGRTRLEAALAIGLSLPVINYCEADLEGRSPFEFALGANRAASCGRRLNDSQVALAAMKNDRRLLTFEREAARERQEGGVQVKPGNAGTVYERLSSKYIVSASRLKKAEAVVSYHDSNLYSKCFRGELSLHRAYLIAKPQLAKKKERKAGVDTSASVAASLECVQEMMGVIAGHLTELKQFDPFAALDVGLLQAFIVS